MTYPKCNALTTFQPGSAGQGIHGSGGSGGAHAAGWAWVYLGCAVLTAMKLWLTASQRISALGASPHDDFHFLSQAASLLGRGSGWGHTTISPLIKGPFFSSGSSRRTWRACRCWSRRSSYMPSPAACSHWPSLRFFDGGQCLTLRIRFHALQPAEHCGHADTAAPRNDHAGPDAAGRGLRLRPVAELVGSSAWAGPHGRRGWRSHLPPCG